MPLTFFVLCGLISTMIFYVCILLAWFSFCIGLLEAGPWYILLIPLLLCAVYFLPFCAVIIGLGYTGVVGYFSEAWKDFTVEVESEGVFFDSAPFERV